MTALARLRHAGMSALALLLEHNLTSNNAFSIMSHLKFPPSRFAVASGRAASKVIGDAGVDGSLERGAI
jgi:hypothetical protein